MIHPHRAGVLATPALLALTSLVFSPCASAQGSDSCATAQVIAGLGPHAFDVTGATTDGLPDTLCLGAGQDDIMNDVWFQWTAPADGTFAFRTCGQTTLDTKIAIYSGTTCPTAGAIACNDDACALQTSVVVAGVTTGQVLLVRLGLYPGTGTTSGGGTFDIVQGGPQLNTANGHWYQGIPAAGITWDDARNAAAA